MLTVDRQVFVFTMRRKRKIFGTSRGLVPILLVIQVYVLCMLSSQKLKKYEA